MRRRAGFTLIEVLAVVLLTGLVVGIALDFYLDLSRASQRAAEQTRGTRRAASLLDRIARDFAGTVFVKKPKELDPLAHPWIFYAESRGSRLGADRVKFMTRNHDPQRTSLPESDLALVSYVLRRNEAGGLELWRSETPGLPETLDREFSAAPREGEALLAEDVAAFGVSFLDAALKPTSSWDSSGMIDKSELPAGVEIHLAMKVPGQDLPLEELAIHRRRVMFLVRPLDLAALLSGEASGPEQDLSRKKVCDCIDCVGLAVDPSAAQLLQEIGGQPAKKWLQRLPANLREAVLPECR